MVDFTFEQRKEMLELITKEQRDFIENYLKRGHKTLFTRFMQSEKISVIKMTDAIVLEEDEQQAEGWQIIKRFDHGLGNRAGKCACGKTLRYEFVVEHVVTKKQIHYGKTHLASFLNIDERDVNTIIDGLHVIDYEADELLMKIQQDDYGYEILDYLDAETTLAKDIQEHIDHHVPLLDRQIRRLRDMIRINKRSTIPTPVTMPVTNSVIDTPFKQSFYRKETNEFLKQYIETEVLSREKIAEIAYQLVLRGENSATTISHIIRNNYNVNKDYSLSVSRRPRIYPTVLSGLHSYAEEGLIYHDQESSGIKDSHFFPNPL